MMPDLCGPMESVSPIMNFIITVVLAAFELDLVIPGFKQCLVLGHTTRFLGNNRVYLALLRMRGRLL
jgi:hypothetical protein